MRTTTTEEARALIATGRKIYFPDCGAGTVHHDAAAELPDGSIVVVRCLLHYGTWEGRVYTRGEAIAHRNRPTPIGIHGGRYSDYMHHQKQCGDRALAGGATMEDIVEVWGRKPPTDEEITAQRERGQRNREAAWRAHDERKRAEREARANS